MNLADTSAKTRRARLSCSGRLTMLSRARKTSTTIETDGKTRRRFLLRYYRLFNLEQCELPQTVLDKLPKTEAHEHDPIDTAERIIADMPNRPEIQYTGSKAFYNSLTDRITLP